MPIKFNMTIAKLISEGSVDGRINAVNGNGDVIGLAKYRRQDGIEHLFDIYIEDSTDVVEMLFDIYGMSISDRNETFHLVIEIPVRDDNEANTVMLHNALEEIKKKHDEKVAKKAEDGHYHKLKIEPIEYILANDLGFCEGNIVKYISRYKDKGKPLDDLRKIKVYVDYLIDELNKNGHSQTGQTA